MKVDNEVEHRRKIRKANRNELIRKKNRRRDFIIYSFCILGIFSLGAFIGLQLFNVSTENYKAYAGVEEKKPVVEENIDLKEPKKDNIKGNKDDNREEESFKSNKFKNNNKQEIKEEKEIKGEPKKEVSKNYNSEKFKNEKVCYLTFDDGPTKNITPEILKVLKEKDVKATFFVLGKMAEVNPELILKEKQEGHLIANHTYSHDYKYVYSNPDNLIKDFKRADAVIKKIIGEEPAKIVRFPGGSFNKGEFQKRVNKEGFHYVDWNCLNGDAEALNVPEEKLISKVKETMGNQEHIVILMHDSGTKQTTARSLGRVIDYIKSKGYSFKTLDEAFDTEYK